jgi:hypothetical protein
MMQITYCNKSLGLSELTDYGTAMRERHSIILISVPVIHMQFNISSNSKNYTA